MNECIDPAVFGVGGADAQAVVMRVCPSVCEQKERRRKNNVFITCGIRTN
jgi:hypothetical protein